MIVQAQARQARAVQPRLALTTSQQRNDALASIGHALASRATAILAANAADVASAQAAGLPGPLIARLRLDAAKLADIVAGVHAVAALPDVLGEELANWTRPNGLAIQRVRVPLGVIGIIYESRPGVTVDAAVLCLKTGNAVLLKGGKESVHSNQALGEALAAGLEDAGLPGGLVQILAATRAAAGELMSAVGLVDVLIPRGGAGLIRAVVAQSRVPVIETGAGVCHIYVHNAADLTMAAAVAVNAKCSSPAVCNAAETLLVDESVAATFLPTVGAALQAHQVALRGCPQTQALLPWAVAASAQDYATEYNDLVLNVRVVADIAAALEHIRTYGTRHSEAIITADPAAADLFARSVDAAAVYHNASTRFTDGSEFGFGAEIGISTQKLHARGPMGLAELTSYKYLIRGTGQVR